jgi:outer membrane protein OmpU
MKIQHVGSTAYFRNGLAALFVMASVNTIANAQSSVTLYGIINPGITYVNNIGGHSAYQMVSGVTQPSRFGLLGNEDLGGGLKATFLLENGFNANNGTAGQGGRLFGRQAYLGMNSNRWGALTAGYQYDFMRDAFVFYENGSITLNGYAGKMGDADRVIGERLANSVKYVSPSLAGFTFGAMYSFGGVPGSFQENSGESFYASYTNGGTTVNAAFTQVRNATQTFGIGVNIFGAPANAQTFDRINVVGLGVDSKFGTYEAHVLGSLTSYRKGNEVAVLRMLDTGISKFVTPSIYIAGGYNYYLINGAHFNQISFGADYLFSKRTDAAIVYGYLLGSSGTNPEFYSVAPSSTRMQQLVNISIRHKF